MNWNIGRRSSPHRSTVVTFDGVMIEASSPYILENMQPLPGARHDKATMSSTSATYDDKMEAYVP